MNDEGNCYNLYFPLDRPLTNVIYFQSAYFRMITRLIPENEWDSIKFYYYFSFLYETTRRLNMKLVLLFPVYFFFFAVINKYEQLSRGMSTLKQSDIKTTFYELYNNLNNKTQNCKITETQNALFIAQMIL